MQIGSALEYHALEKMKLVQIVVCSHCNWKWTPVRGWPERCPHCGAGPWRIRRA